MAFSTSLQHCPVALAVVFICFCFCQFGKADNVYPPNTAAAGVLSNEYYPGQGSANGGYPGQGGANRGYPGQGGANGGHPGQGGANRGYPGQGGANGGYPGQGGANRGYPETGSVDTNPDHILPQVLLCFNEKQIYSTCNEDYRLSQKGELNVPPDCTDQYCNGACVSETDLVLSCIEGLFYNFKFYNKATINDVRETIKSGCSYGPDRGDFNVAEHVQDEYSKAHKTDSNLLLYGIVLMIMAHRLLP